MRFCNPIIPGFYPDPSICRYGNDYYLVTSSFGYVPGIPIFHSTNLIEWKQIGYVLSRPNQIPLGEGKNTGLSVIASGIYAPTIRYYNGWFYVISTNVTAGINCIVRAQDPAGPWTDPLILEWGGIDPSLLFDNDGKVYLTGTGTVNELPGIYQAEIDIETGCLCSPRRRIWQGTGGKYPEGPHLYHIDAWYYLMIAEGGTEYGHMETIARSTSPWGPFESCPYNPILSHRSTDEPIQSVGHGDLIQAHDGSWWMVHLGVRPHGYPPVHHLGRETFLAPVQWDKNGWPRVGVDGRTFLEMEGPRFYQNNTSDSPGKDKNSAVFRDDFDGIALSSPWCTLRNVPPGILSLTEHPGWLILRGTAATLDDALPMAFVGCRQRHFSCRVRTLITFVPLHAGEEAGLVVYMSERFYYELALCKLQETTYQALRSDEAGGSLIFRRRIGSLQKVETLLPLTVPSLELWIEATEETYRFGYRLTDETLYPSGGESPHLLSSAVFSEKPEGLAVLQSQTGSVPAVHWIGEGETRLLSTEVAGGFTGIFFGLYATGNGKACQSPASFDFFEYQPE
ncbi:MAG: glycoside hydrolase family 43 protein [Breznakiellaceae bacterium]